MNDRLATTLFPEWSPELPSPIRVANKLLRRRPLWLRIERAVDGRYDMTTLEQRLNLMHLLTNVIENGVAGDSIEIGTFEGKTAALLTRVLEEMNSGKRLHAYDAFDVGYFLGEKADVLTRLHQNFASVQARAPEIHQGLFSETIPAQLPTQVCFAHLDCGVGPNLPLHKKNLLHVLEHLYPRMAPGGVCAFMDYNDGSFPDVHDGHPGVRMAADEFLQDKPEKIVVLYGGQGAMGYFRREFIPHAAPLNAAQPATVQR